ncbi:MAG: lipopolysaccharide transport system permease protein [Thermoleophilaceae bacterium]|nr:lipopolysaccharide transport system permease protein [Thermoleophilaceae bacterium]
MVITPPSVASIVRDAWHSRRLGYLLGERLVAKSYVRTVLGKAWLVLRPLMETVGMALIFGGVLGAPSSGDIPYFLFLLVGMMGWRLFERPLHWSIRSFDRYARIGRSLRAPLLLFPVAGAGPGLVECAVYPVIVLGAAGVFAVTDGTFYLQLGPGLLAAAGGLVLAYLFGQGLGLVLSVLNARARDVRMVSTYLLNAWLFATPIVYPISSLPSPWRSLAQINPLTSIVELVKWGILGEGQFTAAGVAWSIAATVGTLAAGLWFFARHADRFTSIAHGQEDDEDDVDYL